MTFPMLLELPYFSAIRASSEFVRSWWSRDGLENPNIPKPSESKTQKT